MTKSGWVYQFGKRTYDLASRTHIMGILNVTPDSFSDGGEYLDPGRAVDRALQMVEEGADIIDVGGESTRPKGSQYGEGAEAVEAEEELQRIIPVITRISSQTDIPISVDTYKSTVAVHAIDAGAVIVNDISGLRFDSEMAATVGRSGASLVLMHIKGTPKTMQENPKYDDVIGEVTSYLAEGIETASRASVRQILIDPGIGFGKLQEHNLSLLKNLSVLKTLGHPIVVGVSRKSFIGNLLNLPIDERIEGSLAGAVAAIMNGANILRVHDVRATKRAAVIADAINSAPADSRKAVDRD